MKTQTTKTETERKAEQISAWEEVKSFGSENPLLMSAERRAARVAAARRAKAADAACEH